METRPQQVDRANKLAVEAREHFQTSRYMLKSSTGNADENALTFAKLARDRAQSYLETVEEITEEVAA